VVEGQADGDERVEDLGQRVVAHAHAPADLEAPPGGLPVPARVPVHRVRADAAIVEPFDVRAVEARVGAVEEEGAARPQDAGGLGEDGAEVVDVGGDPRRDDRGKDRAREREHRPVGPDHLGRPAAGEPQLIGRHVHPDDVPAGAGQGGKQQAGPAAEVEAEAVAGAEQPRDVGGVVGDVEGPPLVVPLRVPVITRCRSHACNATLAR
jgi:hypothetical protein